MISLLIIFVLSILPFITTWITSPEEVFIEAEDESKKVKSIFKKKTTYKLTRRGYFFLGIAFVTTLFAWLQYRDSEKEKRNLHTELAARDSINRLELRERDITSRREQYKRDSINNEKIRERDSTSSFQLLVRDSIASVRVEKGKNETISELAKYGLKYDSSQQVIAKLVRDSAKKTYIQAADPALGLCMNDGIEIKKYDEDSLIIILRKCAFVAQSKNVNISMYFMVDVSPNDNTRNLRFLDKQNFIEHGGEMQADERRSAPFNYYIKGAPKMKGVLIWIKGTFNNSDYSKSFEIDRVYELHMNSPTMLLPTDPEPIKDFIYRNNFY